MSDPAPKRRWFQFSIRELLLLATAVAFAIAWLQAKRSRQPEEMTIVEAADYMNERGRPEMGMLYRSENGEPVEYVMRRQKWITSPL